MTIDGNLDEWPDEYNLTITLNDNNVWMSSDMPLDTLADWNARFYAAWDADYVYFGVKVITDDFIVSDKGNWTCDAVSIYTATSASSTGVCIADKTSDNLSFGVESIFSTLHEDFVAGVNPTGNHGFPTYEFKIRRASLPKLDYLADDVTSFEIAIGGQDRDERNFTDLGFGVDCRYPKDEFSSQYYDAHCYPKYFLVDSVLIKNEERIVKSTDALLALTISPNPFTPATSIGYRIRAPEKGVLSIYNVAGAKLFSQEVQRQGRVSWNAVGMASGTYLVRITAGERVLQKKVAVVR